MIFSLQPISEDLKKINENVKLIKKNIFEIKKNDLFKSFMMKN